jgi:hypothetical protein
MNSTFVTTFGMTSQNAEELPVDGYQLAQVKRISPQQNSQQFGRLVRIGRCEKRCETERLVMRGGV